MYSIILNIKHKDVYDRMVQEVQEAIAKDEENEATHGLENIQIGETSSSAELNLTHDELWETEEEEVAETAQHQED